MARERDERETSGLGGFLRGLRDLLEFVASLPADEGGPAMLEKRTEKVLGKLRATQGWTVRLGVPGKEETGEGSPAGQEFPPAVEREPLFDLFSGEDGLTILCELPGIAREDIQLRIEGEEGPLDLHARTGPRSYSKEIALPCPVRPESLQWSFRHGLLEIRLERKQPSPEEHHHV